VPDTIFVSIIIPTLNSDKYLERCLISIADQINRSFEVIVVDGLSQDSTLNIAHSFESRLPALTVISETDSGIYDAMNKGAAKARGQFVYFIGSDDYLYSNHVLSEISRHVSKGHRFHVFYGDVFAEKYSRIYDGKFTYDKLLVSNICHQAVLMKREVFNSLGGFNIRFSVLADWDLNLRWFSNCRIKQKYISVVFAMYSAGGLSDRLKDNCFIDQHYMLKQQHAYLSQPRFALLAVWKWIIKQRKKVISRGCSLYRLCLQSINKQIEA